MQDIYEEMIVACRNIAASFPSPRFYSSCRRWLDLSRSTYDRNPQVRRCRERILHELRDNFGHGMGHAEKVALEAGALAYLEGERLSLGDGTRHEAGILAQMAGLLHDIRRGEKEHAKASAAAAEKILAELSFVAVEQGKYIVEAIANHEAFVEPKRVDSTVGQVISDALYDADKFRWGPDNFTFTLWRMLSFSQAPIVRLIKRFPGGMQGIARVKKTFRSEAGKTYGPEFIDLGLQIGEKIYQWLQDRFAAELQVEGQRENVEGNK
jgi:hypothetical protein